jgi:predicted AlkP superfamily pyrophosphatase or phosphodiesterase
MRRGLFGFLFLAVVTCSSWAFADRPRLVVVVSIDQLPYEYLERLRSGFSAEGLFLKLCDDGANFINCHHGQAYTKTGPGHSVFLTGTFPCDTGIVENDWYDRREKRTVYCVEDREQQLVGASDSGKGMSPRNLLVSTLGDVLKLSNPRSKVFAVALKDRAAVLMAGHAPDGVYWFDSSNGNWITSTYYRRDLPGYLRNLNEGDAAEMYAGKTWSLLYGPEKYTQFSPDDSAHETNLPGLGRTFPHQLPGATVAALYYKAMTTTPFGNDFTLSAAKAIIEAEKLGQDDAPDVLAVNLSSNDYVGHLFGPHSLEAQDITYRTDLQLAEFVKFIDQHLGGAPWVLALSSDHGVAPVPELAASRGLPAGRDPLGNVKTLSQKVEAVLRQQLGEPAEGRRYVQEIQDQDIYLNREIPELAGDRFLLAQRVVRDWLVELPGVAVAYTREDLMRMTPSAGLALAFHRTFNPKRSGDVLFGLAPYLINGKIAATHGSPWNYDSHVPLIFWGAGIRAGRHDQRVTPAAMAPTLARLLGIEAPPACSVEALGAALKQLH